MKTIFFIPARGGSTRVKNKNLKKIDRTSILAKKIKNCLATKLGKVYVSTDSKKIAQISTNNGANILDLRPKSLSTSKSSMLSSIINFLENYQKKYFSLPDFIILAPTTNPFLKKNSICQSIKVLKNKLVHRMAYTMRKASSAMLITSVTTAASFMATGISPIMPLVSFGIFSALVIVVNYILIITFLPSVYFVYEIHISKRFKCFKAIKLCFKKIIK